MSLLDTQDEILAKLMELPQDVYDGFVPDESKLKFDSNGNILPYIVLETAGVTASVSGMPISGVAGASGDSSVSVLCIAPTQRSSRQVAAMVRSKLTGFVPNKAGELKPIFSPYTYVVSDITPAKYVTEITFSFILDSVW